MSGLAPAAVGRPPDEALLELQREGASPRLSRTGPTGLLAAGFLAAGAASLALPSHEPLSYAALATAIVAYALASRVEVEFPGFAAIPTEAVFVVMWFVLPLPTLPLAVCGAMLLGQLPDVARRRISPDRLALTVASGWYALGPALVLSFAGTREPRWQDAPYYVAALAAQFAFDFAATFLMARSVVALAPRTHARSVLSAYAFDTVLAPLGLLAAFPANRYPEAMLLLLPMLLLVHRIGTERAQKHDADLALKDAYQGTSYLLGDMIEADDSYTGEHSRDVVQLVLDVARRLELDPAKRPLAEFTALLHDVGKLRIPNAVLHKTGPLDAAERALVETHTVLGQEMLERAGGLLGQVGPYVRSCHERWDGHGYPDGLAGDEIPLLARIVCACDAWSAMTTDRPYRSALTRDAAAAELRGGSGTQFDPAVVEALAAVLELPA